MQLLSSRIVRSLSISGFAALLSVPAFAQAPHYKSEGSLWCLQWPASYGTPGTFTRTAAGEFTADGILDTVTLAGTTPVVLWNPAFQSMYAKLDTTANDIDVVAGAGAYGQDGIAVVGPDGLKVWSLIDGAPPHFVAAPVGSSNWVGALRVSSGDIDHGGLPDFLGLKSDQHTLVWSLAEMTYEKTYYSSAAVLDVALGNWKSDAELEIFVLTANGILVIDAYATNVGTVLATLTHNSGYTSLAMTTVPASKTLTGDIDRVAAITVNGSARELRVYAQGVTTATITLPPTINYVGMAAGDADADGDFDLMLSHKRCYGPLYVENGVTSTNPAFSNPPSGWNNSYLVDDYGVAQPTVLSPAYGASSNQGWPVFADFNDDGHADLLLPMQQSTPIGPGPGHMYLDWVFGSQSGNATFFQGGVLAGQLNGGGTAFSQMNGYLWFGTTLMPFHNSNPGVPVANAVRLTIWRQPGSNNALNEVPVYDKVAPIESASSNVTSVGAAISFPVNDGCFTTTGDHELYWLMLQPLKINAGQHPIPSGITNYTVERGWAPKVAMIFTDGSDFCDYMVTSTSVAQPMTFSWPTPTLQPQPASGNYVYDHDASTSPTYDDACGGGFSCVTPPGTYPGSWNLPGVCNRTRLPAIDPDNPPTPSLQNAPTIGAVYVWPN